MAIMDANYDQEMMRLWGIISDLSDQLNQHRATASALRNQAEGIKVNLQLGVNAFYSGGPHAGYSRAKPSTLKLASCCAGVYSWPMFDLKLCSSCGYKGSTWISHRVCANSFDYVCIDPSFSLNRGL